MTTVLEAGVAIYVALAVALAVWVGIFVYVWRLDSQARALRRRLEQAPAREAHPAAPSATLRAQQPNDASSAPEPSPEPAARAGNHT